MLGVGCMFITRPGPSDPEMLVTGDTRDLGITGEMEASWTISWLIRIVLVLRLHLASFSFPCGGKSRGPLLWESVCHPHAISG